MADNMKITTDEQLITISPTAVEEIKRLMAQEKDESLFLRLGVSAGGCSGMSYSMAFDDQPSELDRVFDFDGLKVRVDLKALMYLKGSRLDYQSGMLGGGFKFSNPNAKRSCGCGSSFTC
jgi:iron-sulfur cluster assembly protein